MKNILEFDRVIKFYNGRAVLNGLSFAIRPRDRVALVGNYGCGKTTTVEILCNLTGYDGGSVVAFDTPVISKYEAYKRRLGIVLSKHPVINEATPWEFLRLVSQLQQVPWREMDERVDHVLALLELDGEGMIIGKLPAGERAKVILGTALLHDPEMLVLDEPFEHLDVATVNKLISVLQTFRGKKAIFITANQLEHVAALCDRFLVMDEGRIVLEISKDHFDTADDLRARIRETLHRAGVAMNLDWLG